MAQQYIQQLTVFLRGGQNIVVPFNAEKPEENQGNFLFQGARVVLIHLPDVSGLDVVSLVRKQDEAQAPKAEAKKTAK